AAHGAPDARARHRVGGLGVDAIDGTAQAGDGDRVLVCRPRRAAALQRQDHRVLRRAGARGPRHQGDERGGARPPDRRDAGGGGMNGLAKRASSAVLPLALAFAVVVGLLLLAGANPFKALGDIWSGSMGNTSQVGDTLMAWVPITLATAGFVVTYAAGLWNIGIEGQIAMGGIVATWVGRTMPGPRPVLITLMFLGGAVGGVVWALLAGLLKTKGGVNEIFGGLGLDFVASGLAVYLIIGPWKRAGIASTSGTKLLPASATLPVLGHTRFSLIAAAVAVAGVTSVWLLLRGTRFGLRLKAVGRNPRSAFLMGISPDRYMLGAFSVCGVLAGVAGAVQVSGVWHKLVPSISGGYGFLAILVALLAA